MAHSASDPLSRNDLDPTGSDSLNSQISARERASREDAAIQAKLRAEAARRAMGEPSLAPLPPTVVVKPLGPPLSFLPDDLTEPRTRPPGVAVPIGGPAAAVSGALAAAAQRPRPTATTLDPSGATVLASDLDRSGERLVIMGDRLELRDRRGGIRRQMALSDIHDVAVQRRLTTAVVVVRSRAGSEILVKGLRGEAAEEVRAAIVAHQLHTAETTAPVNHSWDSAVHPSGTATVPTEPTPAVATVAMPALEHPTVAPTELTLLQASLMDALDLLHEAGILDDDETATRSEMVTRLYGRRA